MHVRHVAEARIGQNVLVDSIAPLARFMGDPGRFARVVLRRGEHETINIRNLFALFCNESTTQYGAIEWKSSQLLLAGDMAEIFGCMPSLRLEPFRR